MTWKTPNEIREHLYRDSNKLSQTSAPCNGCGYQYIGYRDKPKPFRSVDKVCPDCKKLILEALDAREGAAAQKDHELVFVNFQAFYEGHNRHTWNYLGVNETPVVGKHDPGYIMKRNLFDLARSLAANLPIPSGQVGRRMFHQASMHAPKGEYLWLKPEHVEILQTLDAAIRSALLDRSKCGEEHGRNLLVGLAEGSVSIEQYNKATNSTKE